MFKMYVMYLDGVQYPVPPSKMELKVKGSNKTVDLADGYEINILNTPELSTFSMNLLLPATPYSFASYPDGFHAPAYYLEKLKQLMLSKKPCSFILNRCFPDGTPLYDTNLTVSLEDYTITDNAEEGFDTTVKITLKEFFNYQTGLADIEENEAGELVVIPKTARPVMGETPATYVVKAGDTMLSIAKALLGTDAEYKTLAIKNGIPDPIRILIGTVLQI